MTSITKSDSELTTNPDSIDSNLTEEPRVSIDDTSNGDKPRASQIELNSIPSPPTDVDSTIVFDGTVNDVDVEVRVSESNDESDGDDKNEDLGFVVSSSDGGKEVYSSLLSDFEDFVANEKREASAATSRARSFGFEIGDMVWGKVKSHPWWPGHIFNEAFASSSVRRTRREGHVLVAFFGDSSYGWFDPAELIPFDPNFAEKSQQTNSRNFVKAVEEAVDEASRRCGLGLVCKCRNKYNFRPTDVPGYLAVDVPDYEAGGVYSDSQIMKARDDFSPAKVLGFMKDLAQVVQFSDTSSIDFIKNKAAFFALRKATFEEFDETYAEAFETQPTRPSSNAVKASGQPPKAPTRAPLSGPLVIAEALGDRKSLKKSPKVKDNVKKEKYLFKRRDEPSDSKAFQIGQKQDDSFVPASYMEGSTLVAAGDYGLQKRMPAPKHELTELISSETAGPRESEPKQLSSEQPSGKFGASATYVVGGQGILQSVDNQMVLDGGGPRTGGSDLSGKEDNLISVDNVPEFSQHEGEGNAAHGLDESTKSLKSNESSHPNEMIVSVGVDGEKLDNIGDGTPGSHLSASVSKNSSVTGTADGAIKKTKVLKRPIGDLNSEKSEMGEKKKKKKKVSVASPDLPVKRSATGKAIMKNSAGKLKQPSLGSAQLDLPELLHNLHDLALDASNSRGQNHRSLARRFFLRYRSLVYQKSVVASPSSGTESVEIRTSKSSSSVGALDNSESVVPSKTVVKPLGRSDDPTKGGEKRLPSDRQEEIAAKRLKKINQLKSIAADKKASHKPLDTQGDVKEPVAGPTLKLTQREAKEPVAASTPNLVKPLSAKKKAPVKAVEPTMLVMKFPPQTSLPSGAELKAKFARFGSIDQSAIRVFWKSSTCRVVFRYKSDAQAAYRYAMGNRSLFGNLEVRYMLREVGAAAEAPESDNARGGDSYVEVPRVKDRLLERPTPPLAPIPLPPSSMQPPKSILKKPNGDEAAVQGTGNNGRGTSRVKFMLGGEETSTTSKPIEQMMTGYRNNINNNNNNSTATSVGVCGAATSVASEYNSKNFQNFVPPPSSLPPLLPSPQFAKPPHPFNNTNLQNPNVPPTTSTVTSASASARQNVDISHEMLSLLTKCNDVVTGVRGLLGYVPYHPL